jgi:hypothetical protein
VTPRYFYCEETLISLAGLASSGGITSALSSLFLFLLLLIVFNFDIFAILLCQAFEYFELFPQLTIESNFKLNFTS